MSLTASVPTELWDFQVVAKSGLWACIKSGVKRPLLVMPTGAGKGTLSANIISACNTAGRSVLFLVNRRELVKDLSRRLDKLGVDHGAIMAAHPRRKPWLGVQIASIDTLRNREKMPHADLIFVDEAHMAISDSWLEILNRFQNNPAIIGMSATPIRLDGTGLGRIFQAIVLGPPTTELIERGFLVQSRPFAPSAPDLRQVKISAGDYNKKQLAAAVDRPKLTGDIVTNWLKLGERRPTVCFTVNREHAKHITDAFLAAGVRARYADANTPDGERDQLWADLETGAVEVFVCVGIATYGWDCPVVSCVILARPTESLALYIQMLGRAARRYPGKSSFIVLDHAGLTLKFGFFEDPREWTLEGCKRKRKGAMEPVPAVRMCKYCWAAFRSTQEKCPHCGWEYVGRKNEIKVAEGTLEEVKRESKLKAVEEWRKSTTEDQRREKFFELVKFGRERNYNPGFASMKFKAMFREWPRRQWIKDAQTFQTQQEAAS